MYVGRCMTRHAFAKAASTTVPVHPLLAERWSPRGFDREHVLGDEALTALLEAARWAPSSQNSQPWRFLVTRRGEDAHGRLFAALGPGNQAWAGAASALVLVAARTAAEDGGPQPWALYDTGQAVAALVTQAQADGLSVRLRSLCIARCRLASLCGDSRRSWRESRRSLSRSRRRSKSSMTCCCKST